MGSDLKQMKYRRRAGVAAVGEFGQCSDPRGVDWGVIKQDPVELLRKLDELRDQITRSCEITGQPREHCRISRRSLSLHPPHPETAPPSRGLQYNRARYVGRYVPGLPPSPRDPLRSIDEERYARQPSGRYRQCPDVQWEKYGFGHGNCCPNTCERANCLHNQQATVQEEHIPMARYFAGQQGSYQFKRSQSVSSDYDQRSVASSLYSHRSMSKRRVEYFRKKAGRFCRQARGAAPFIMCSSCYQLLQLPLGKCTARKQNRLQCGACSEIITLKIDKVKVRPFTPSSPFPVLKTVQSSNHRMHQGFGYRQHNDGNSTFYKLPEHTSMPHNMDFADENSLSSTVHHDRTDRECVSNRSIQLKVESFSLSSSTSRDADIPKDILCQGDADSQVEDSVDGTVSPQVPVLVDKLVNLLPNQEKDGSGIGQSMTKKYNLNIKEYYNARIGGKSIGMKCESKRKEDNKHGLADESMSGKYEQKSKEANTGSTEGGSMSKNYELKSNESMSEKHEQKSKQDGNGYEAKSISKRYAKYNREDDNDAIGGESLSKRYEQKNIQNNNGNLHLSYTETAPSVNECTNSETELDEGQSSTGKSGDSSFFAGFLKKGFKDLSLFNQSMDSVKVSINGHPITERALKKAEKKSGPVGPGSYWYDYHAGFWGVMGRECIGIIPPFVKEFNYPMPKNCSGGNTGVFVNGRELQQRDLDLLVGRGLPCISGKSYSIEISGNVTDDMSGKKLRSLGKLAPTIEKLKRGFGMRVPEDIS